MQAYYDCPPSCGAGETCILDLVPSFGTLLEQHLSKSIAGYPGTSCQVLQETSPIDSSNSNDSEGGSKGGSIGASNTDNLPDSFFLIPDGCPFDCQNGGKCMSIFGGLSYSCLCVEPFWGSECEINGQVDPCPLDCSSIVSTDSLQIGNDNDLSQSRPGAFCVEPPSNSVVENGDVDQTCVFCEELSDEDEPNCEDLSECKNDGVCKIDYLFTTNITSTDPSEGDEAKVQRPLKCSSTITTSIDGIDGSEKQTYWEDLSPYKLSCDCQPGFQGETCEEIDVCGGGCKNDGYCISKDTPGDKFGDDDLWNFDTDDSNFNDDLDNDLNDNYYPNDDGQDDPSIQNDDDDDDSYDGDLNDIILESDCTCESGDCDQTKCGEGASCTGGMCDQNYLISPMCSGGKCSQRHTGNPTCIGGDCDQTSAVGATCTGSDCFYDDIEAQTMEPNTGTMTPGFEPFCSCEYGYFGDQCQHKITAICLFGEFSLNQLIHEFCLKADGLCPLDLGDKFCANDGTCGDIEDIILPTLPNLNNTFSCTCSSDFEGVHCEVAKTEAPSAGPTTKELPTIEPTLPSRSSHLQRKFYTSLVLVLPFIFDCFQKETSSKIENEVYTTNQDTKAIFNCKQGQVAFCRTTSNERKRDREMIIWKARPLYKLILAKKKTRIQFVLHLASCIIHIYI